MVAKEALVRAGNSDEVPHHFPMTWKTFNRNPFRAQVAARRAPAKTAADGAP